MQCRYYKPWDLSKESTDRSVCSITYPLLSEGDEKCILKSGMDKFHEDMELTQLKTLTMVLIISSVHTASIKPNRQILPNGFPSPFAKACDGIMSPEDFQEGHNSQK